jgi:hypothetical protein
MFYHVLFLFPRFLFLTLSCRRVHVTRHFRPISSFHVEGRTAFQQVELIHPLFPPIDIQQGTAMASTYWIWDSITHCKWSYVVIMDLNRSLDLLRCVVCSLIASFAAIYKVRIWTRTRHKYWYADTANISWENHVIHCNYMYQCRVGVRHSTCPTSGHVLPKECMCFIGGDWIL